MRLDGSDGSVDSEWQTSANYILVEVAKMTKWTGS